MRVTVEASVRERVTVKASVRVRVGVMSLMALRYVATKSSGLSCKSTKHVSCGSCFSASAMATL